MCISTLGRSRSPSRFFDILLIHSDFLLMISWFPYFTLKSFSFFCIRLLVFVRVISSNLLVEFLSWFWNVLFLYCFTLYRYLFNLPSFASTFWFISSSCYFFLCCFSLLSRVSAFFLCFIIFACFRRFLICVSSQIFHLDFAFLSVLFKELRFSHKLISLLHKLVHLIRLCFWLTYMLVLDLFFGFVLTILHFMFLTDDKVNS